MAGWRVHGPEKDGYKRMERQSKGPRDLEVYCSGGQGPPRAVAPTDDDSFLSGSSTVASQFKGASLQLVTPLGGLDLKIKTVVASQTENTKNLTYFPRWHIVAK